MKRQEKELDVDFIGGQEPLTVAEENSVSEFFRKKKELKSRKSGRDQRINPKLTPHKRKSIKQNQHSD